MSYRIPLFKLNFDEQEVEAVVRTIQSKWISAGPRVQQLEETFAEMVGADYAVALSSCTSALHLALLALGVKAGDEVIVPSLSFAATANCVRYVGATPVFCDIESLSEPTIALNELEQKITEKTRAIIPMHYAGFACRMHELMCFAKQHDLLVIEDACHGPLSEYREKKLGTIGHAGCFSFFSNKNISTGEGGILVTNSKETMERVKLLRSHGMTTMSYDRAQGHSTSYDIVELGYNFRMDDIRASIGLVQLKKIQEDLASRAKIRKAYLDNLSEVHDIIIPFSDSKEFSSNYIFPVVLKGATSELRDSVRNRLHESGIQTSVHYPAIHRFSIYQEFACGLQLTEQYADSAITLPMYASLSIEDINYICQALSKAISNGYV
jgi:dTDP-4-amino-4,6-dideoxygalactose transaminase